MDIFSYFKDTKGEKSYHNLLTMFYQVMGIPVKVINVHGEEVLEIGWQHRECSPCNIIRNDSEQKNRCHENCHSSCSEALRWGDTYISRCHLNFIRMSVPILMNEEVIGGLVGCPFLTRPPTEQFISSALKIVKPANQSKMEFADAVYNVPVILEKRVKLASELLFSLADFFSIPDLGLLTARRHIYREQAQLAEEIQSYKRNVNVKEHHLLPILTPKREKELITKVRLGDKIGAKTILNEFLAQIMLHNPINIELMKSYVLELSAILTRAVVEEGANPEDILGLRYRFISELSDISNYESLCFWVVKMMESICDNIYQTRNNQHFHILENACKYIKEHYAEKLTLTNVAQAIYISPFYLCHLFKEDLNTTFVEFLTKTRIDAAKTLLRESNFQLSQIALEVGFPDQSYFTKVFKRIEQITPKTYRRLTASVM